MHILFESKMADLRPSLTMVEKFVGIFGAELAEAWTNIRNDFNYHRDIFPVCRTRLTPSKFEMDIFSMLNDNSIKFGCLLRVGHSLPLKFI